VVDTKDAQPLYEEVCSQHQSVLLSPKTQQGVSTQLSTHTERGLRRLWSQVAGCLLPVAGCGAADGTAVVVAGCVCVSQVLQFFSFMGMPHPYKAPLLLVEGPVLEEYAGAGWQPCGRLEWGLVAADGAIRAVHHMCASATSTLLQQGGAWHKSAHSPHNLL
jgi:hypothetical protein